MTRRERISVWLAEHHPRVFRIAFGSYCALHFATLVPWGRELWSTEGMLANPKSSPFFAPFPFASWAAWPPELVGVGLIVASVAGVAFACNRHPRVCAALLWAAFTCTYLRNPFIGNPSLPFVGWIAACFAMAGPERAEPRAGAMRSAWSGPAIAFVILSVAYTYSGLTKLPSPSWFDGSALARIIDNPLARASELRIWVSQLPELCLVTGSYLVLALEIAFAPLALIPRLRPWLWSAMVAMHLGIVVLIDFTDLSMGMLLVHVYTFDPMWLRRGFDEGRRVAKARARPIRELDLHAIELARETPASRRTGPTDVADYLPNADTIHPPSPAARRNEPAHTGPCGPAAGLASPKPLRS